MQEPIISIEEYRRLMDDVVSTEAQIVRRIEYIESLCRNVIREELGKWKQDKVL